MTDRKGTPKDETSDGSGGSVDSNASQPGFMSKVGDLLTSVADVVEGRGDDQPGTSGTTTNVVNPLWERRENLDESFATSGGGSSVYKRDVTDFDTTLYEHQRNHQLGRHGLAKIRNEQNAYDLGEADPQMQAANAELHLILNPVVEEEIVEEPEVLRDFIGPYAVRQIPVGSVLFRVEDFVLERYRSENMTSCVFANPIATYTVSGMEGTVFERWQYLTDMTFRECRSSSIVNRDLGNGVILHKFIDTKNCSPGQLEILNGALNASGRESPVDLDRRQKVAKAKKIMSSIPIWARKSTDVNSYMPKNKFEGRRDPFIFVFFTLVGEQDGETMRFEEELWNRNDMKAEKERIRFLLEQIEPENSIRVTYSTSIISAMMKALEERIWIEKYGTADSRPRYLFLKL